MSRRLAAVVAGGSCAAWEALGFSCDESPAIAFGNGSIELDESRPSGLLGLRVIGIGEDVDIEGIPVGPADASRAPAEHPNGCFELDHLVILTDDLDRTSATLERVLGLERRRLRATSAVR